MMKTILFQGDSITDGGRSREYDHMMGRGYANLVSGTLGLARPNEFKFFNRGVGGNRSIDMLARIKPDCINLKPDYMSVLIGINDIWHGIDGEKGIDTKRYELYYNLFIEETREALPDVKIMILEPFVLKGAGTEEHYDLFRTETEEKAAASKRVAEKNDLLFVPLMEKFDALTKIAPNEYWLSDGVHPTVMGHEFIKNEWLKAFEIMEKKDN